MCNEMSKKINILNKRFCSVLCGQPIGGRHDAAQKQLLCEKRAPD